MMKLLSITLLLWCMITSCSETIIAQGYIKGKQFEGYIFPKEYIPTLVHFDDAKERYTPTHEDVIKVEQALKTQLAAINNPLINQGGSCPIIHSNLSRYKRQYIGYINQKGDKVIWVNFVFEKEKDQISRLSKDVIIVLDGCSSYWNIKLNLTEDKLYDLRINGSA